MSKEYQILMYAGEFVDEKKLHKGIYSTKSPTLHGIAVSKESLINRAKSLSVEAPGLFSNYDFKNYELNMRQCSLVTYWLTKKCERNYSEDNNRCINCGAKAGHPCESP